MIFKFSFVALIFHLFSFFWLPFGYPDRKYYVSLQIKETKRNLNTYKAWQQRKR